MCRCCRHHLDLAAVVMFSERARRSRRRSARLASDLLMEPRRKTVDGAQAAKEPVVYRPLAAVCARVCVYGISSSLRFCFFSPYPRYLRRRRPLTVGREMNAAGAGSVPVIVSDNEAEVSTASGFCVHGCGGGFLLH